MKEFLENFASILGVSTIAMLLLAVSHELGYFWLIGSEFQALLTTTDYLTNAIFWLPLALMFAYGSIEWWRFDEPAKEPKKDWRKLTTWIWPSIVGLFIGWLVLTSSWPPGSYAVLSYLGIAVFVWSKIWRRVPVNVLQEPFQSVARGFVRLGVPAMIAMFAHGWMTAASDLTLFDGADIFHLKGIKEPKLLISLRSLDKGVLLRNPATDRIEFYRWDSIDSFERIRKTPSRSIACYIFDFCPPRYSIPAP
jgi:hypothetical protein